MIDSPITLNGIPFWFTSVNEAPDIIKTDSFAIDGTMKRSRFPDKRRAVLTKNNITAAEYQAIKAMVDSGDVIHYVNTHSIHAGGVLEFDAIPDDNLDAYSLSADPRAPFTLTLREP